MVNQSNKFKNIVLLAVVGIASVSVAEVKPIKEIERVESKNVAAQQQKSSSNLRCWQHGELLFEETEIKKNEIVEESLTAVFESKNKRNKQRTYLINLGEATCLYKDTFYKS